MKQNRKQPGSPRKQFSRADPVRNRVAAITIVSVSIVPCLAVGFEGIFAAPAARDFQERGRFLLSGRGPVWVGNVVANKPLGIANPSEYCLEDGYIWKGADYRLGRLNVFGADAGLKSGTRIVYGQVGQSLDARIKRDRKCPPDYSPPAMQLRGDWTSPECGFNIGHSTHARLKELTFIQARAAFALQMVEVNYPKGFRVNVRLHNPFAVPLDGLEIRAHYEGGPGKPQPRYINIRERPAPGKSVEIGLDPRIHDPRKPPPATDAGRQRPPGKGSPPLGAPRRFVLRSIEITGKIGEANFDLTYPAR